MTSFEKKINIIFLIVIFGILFSNNILAQRGGSGSSTNQRPGQAGAGQKKLRKIPKDSLLIFYYSIDNPNQEFPYQDTLLDNYLHQFDPARSRTFDYGSLGYMGSALQPLIYTPRLRSGFDIGLHQYDLYKIEANDLRFYNLKTAYSDFYFTQGGAQDDIQLKAKFSRNFANNINLSIDYHRISQFGTTDPIAYFYQNQRARHTALAGGIAFHNNENTYRGFFTFANNIHEQEDNGGIESEEDFLNQESGFSSTLSIPVWLDDAATRHGEWEISYTQYYIYNPQQRKELKKRKAEEKARRIAAAALAAQQDSLRQLQDSLATPTLDSLGNIIPDSTIAPTIDSLKNIIPDSTASPKVDSLKNIPPKPAVKTDGKPNPKSDAKNNSRPRPPANDRDGKRKTPSQRPTSPSSGRPLPPTPTVDKSLPDSRSFTFSHRISYKEGTYKFSDITAAADSNYWNNLLLDERGLRHFITTRKLENKFAISTFKPRKGTPKNIQLQNDFLEIGIRHALHQIDEEAADSTINNLFLTGKWNFNPNERLKVETYAHLGLWDNAGDYQIKGDLFFDLKKIGQLKLSGGNQLYSPNILQQRFYISQREAWNNDFKATLETNLSASYALPRLGFQVEGRYNLLNNYIYFDTLATPQQAGSAVSIFQLILHQNFTLRKFHIDNSIVLQQTTNDVLNLPSFYSKHSFYYEGRWFKQALQIRLGFDLRMNNRYFANTYNPLIGQFHLQNSQQLNFFPAVDAYSSIKVKQFRFFIKSENMTRLFANLFGSISDDIQYYQTALYPMQNNRFRFGLAWKFVD